MTFFSIFYKYFGMIALSVVLIYILQVAFIVPVFGPDSFTPIEKPQDLIGSLVVAVAVGSGMAISGLRNRSEGVLINLPCAQDDVKARLQNAFGEVKKKKPGVWDIGKRTSGWRVKVVEHKNGQTLLHFTALYPLQIMRSKPAIKIGKLVTPS